MDQVHPVAVTANGEPIRQGAEVGPPGGGRTVNLGGGRVVPYPEPRDAAATKIGKANRRTDTKPEVRLRSLLHRRGHRFRKDHLVRVGTVRVRPDVVFTRWKVAVFVDGCFWHGCPDHQSFPKSNRDYWVPKLAANVERDRRVDAALGEAGWVVVRIWEHEDVERAVAAVGDVLGSLRGRLPR
jgi:DNA mismatch endonuclease (patch repair protein)